jgi:hypothetical protein
MIKFLITVTALLTLAGCSTGPTTLIHSTVTLEARHMETWPFDLQSDGMVTVTVLVTHGNPIDVCVTFKDAPGQIWTNTIQTFYAENTKGYERSQRLTRGHYYLGIRDHLDTSNVYLISDVSVNIQESPTAN